MSATATYTVQYFAALRERRGLREESVASGATTAGELYAELQARHALVLEPAQVQAAVNGRMVPAAHRLAPGDVVLFLPPVAGG
ncbi:MAG: MoaD/ThiS family protein [Verrucomicrobia bacterium]|nr:MoaD/ThiS family protein [Verrucomicrobiota bacterium]